MGMLWENEVFQCGDRLSLFNVGLFSSFEGTHVSVQRKPFTLQSGVPNTFLPYD
jgi:hypothetical protein